MSFKGLFSHGSGKPMVSARPLTEDETRVIEKVAVKVVEWKMTVPAILFLESVKPLNFIGAQALIFFEPFVQTLFNFKDYDTFRELMERRESVEHLLVKIEELDAAALEKEKQARRERRSQRPGWFSRLRRKAP